MPKFSRQWQSGQQTYTKIRKSTTLNSDTFIWKFNVPKAPWWGGQFERLNDLIKASL